MKNLVYANGSRTLAKLASVDKAFAQQIRAAWEPHAKKFFEEEMLKGEIWKDTNYPGVTFRKRDLFTQAMMEIARKDGVAPQFAGDHAKDMGYQRSIDVDRSLPPLEAFIKPLDIAEIRYHYNHLMQQWIFTDDRNFTFNADPKAIEHGATFKFMDREFIFGPMVDKLRRLVPLKDDRGAIYDIDLTRRTGGRVRATIPIRGVLTGTWITQDPNNKQQGGAIMAQAKSDTTEKPIHQQPVKLSVYFRVNSMPQELTQKQANEHVAKLLTLGADQVSVQRYIRDETSERYTNQTDYR